LIIAATTRGAAIGCARPIGGRGKLAGCRHHPDGLELIEARAIKQGCVFVLHKVTG
jgi:hypothetical protein